MSEISLTAEAAEHVRRYVGENAALRLAIKRTGCSGYQYVVEKATGPGEGDRVFESRGITVVVDEKSLPFLAGVELDYRRQGLNEGFEFRNPNAGETCGCGESFTMRDELQEEAQ